MEKRKIYGHNIDAMEDFCYLARMFDAQNRVPAGWADGNRFAVSCFGSRLARIDGARMETVGGRIESAVLNGRHFVIGGELLPEVLLDALDEYYGEKEYGDQQKGGAEDAE